MNVFWFLHMPPPMPPPPPPCVLVLFLVHQFFEDAVQAISNFNLQNLSLLQQGIHNQLLQGARRLCRRCGQPPAQAKFMAYDMGLTGDFKCTFIQHHM